MEQLIQKVELELLPELRLAAPDSHDPVVVQRLPRPWQVLGTGNYAAVLHHPDYPEAVVKIYAPGRKGLEEEAEVYRRLGKHPAYSACFHVGGTYLILQRLRGVTMFECVRRGIRIPVQAVRDIDEALAYARARGLHPHDIHGKNVMVADGRGQVVDVSDFLKEEPCEMWDDLKKAYYKFYMPLLLRRPVPVPLFLLNGVRKLYRRLRRFRDRSRG